MQSITPWRKETAGKRVTWRGFHWELNVPDHNDTFVGQNQWLFPTIRNSGSTTPSVSRGREGQNI